MIGLRLECIRIDTLHTVDLGAAAHIIANIMMACITAHVWVSNQDLGIVGLRAALAEFYTRTRCQKKMQGKLTIDRIRTQNAWPKLKAKGAVTRHLAPFALQLAESYLGVREQMLCRLLVRFYDLLREEGHFLSADAKLELPELGRSMVQLYNVFAAESAVAKTKMWKGLPKLHLFQHMCEWQAPEYGNPRFWWCYADEDFVGQFIDVAESCHPKTLPVTSIWKWLILIFEEAIDK